MQRTKDDTKMMEIALFSLRLLPFSLVRRIADDPEL